MILNYTLYKYYHKKLSRYLVYGISRSLHCSSNIFSTNKNYGVSKDLVLGCGSNVVDQIHRVQAVPNVGEKGFFLSPVKTLEKSIVGGVALNHLAWASLLGVPTGLLALQGDDKPGKFIRDALKDLNVSREFIQVSKEYTSSESYIFLQPDGERSIIMATGATSQINSETVKNYFRDHIVHNASMLTTEISGVLELLTIAKDENILTLLDFDVSPQVAFDEAKLGDMDQLKQILMLADVIKPAKHAAHGLLKMLRPDLNEQHDIEDIMKFLQDITNAKLIAMTNAGKDSVLATDRHMVHVPTLKLDHVVDATGAGDAFLGGLIAGLYFDGLPRSEKELRSLGVLANRTGACNCLTLGALPVASSAEYMQDEIETFHGSSKTLQHKSVEVHVDASKVFKNSLTRDIEACSEILHSIDMEATQKFIGIVNDCPGSVFTSGIGKSGLVSNRLAASLSSIGVSSHYVHACEWAHGDLGKIHDDDIVIFLSHSGNTNEVLHAAELMKRKNIPMLGILGTENSAIASMCDACLTYMNDKLVEPLGGIPTTSILLQDAIINAILCDLIERRRLTRRDFVVNHPGGCLGKIFSNDA